MKTGMKLQGTDSLHDYCIDSLNKFGEGLPTCTVFAKILTSNDDSGRHGVLVPTEAYEFFPYLEIANPSENATAEFHSFDSIESKQQLLGYKYYQRYPERRITRLNSSFNEMTKGKRLAIFLRFERENEPPTYCADLVFEADSSSYAKLWDLIFGVDIQAIEGAYIVRSVNAPKFRLDPNLQELLDHFDRIKNMGLISSLRAGSTGIGYTFETLVGIQENNDQVADFKGIEIKCKRKKGGASGGKINLFQLGPTWLIDEPAIDRLKRIGKLSEAGLYNCHSQLTTETNNLGLALDLTEIDRILLRKQSAAEGFWLHERLAERLAEKHTRSLFIKAKVSTAGGGEKFHYDEAVYCQSPSIEKFIALIKRRQLVFEFIMSEKEKGRVRNHGYPWRLNNEDTLQDLFDLQVKVR